MGPRGAERLAGVAGAAALTAYARIAVVRRRQRRAHPEPGVARRRGAERDRARAAGPPPRGAASASTARARVPPVGRPGGPLRAPRRPTAVVDRRGGRRTARSR